MAPLDDRPCEGPIQRAHWLDKQVLKRRAPDLDIWDRRLWRPVCERHHNLVDRRLLDVPRDLVPESVEELAAGYDLGWWLDRRYGPR